MATSGICIFFAKHFPAIEFNCPIKLCEPVFRHSTLVLLHGGVGGHSVEELPLLPVLLDDLSSGLVVAGQHASQHHEVGSGSDGLGHVSGAGAAAVLK